MVKRLPYSITIDDIGICHAEPPSFDWNDSYNPTPMHVYDMLWGRHFMQTAGGIDNIRHTYRGHEGVKKPVTVGNSTFIDTNYVGGYLTIMEIK